MNDPFEQRLQRQAMREIPTAWRAEILTAAQAAKSSGQPHRATESIRWHQWLRLIATTLWRELFWPSRFVWSGVAAAWLTLLAINQSMDSADAGSPADAAPTMEIIEAAQTQRRMLAELAEPIAEHAVDRAKNIHLSPQSRNESKILFT